MKRLWDRFGELSPGKCRVRLEAFGNSMRALQSVPGSKCVETHGTAAEYIFLLVYPACTGFRWGNFKLEHIGVFP